MVPRALAQQIANGTDVVLLDGVLGDAVSPFDGAFDAAMNDHQPFS